MLPHIMNHPSIHCRPEAALGKTSQKKLISFRHCPNYLPPPPNDVSDNCDLNFGTFDDFGVKNDPKVSHNMILMSKYKGQHGGKKG